MMSSLNNYFHSFEISIDQIDKSPDNTVSLIKYVHLRHKKNKVEIVVQNK